MRRLNTFIGAALCALMAGSAAAQEAAPAPVAAPDYEGEAKRIMAGLGATGMTAAVLVDGKVVYNGALGLREYGKTDAVTRDTLFPIASISKAFTTTALAMLVDEGKIAWDDPVKKYIPEFALSDPWVTEYFTIRDALTHRSGLPLGAGDLLIWPDGDASAKEVIASLRYQQPATGFRTAYAYDNLFYIVAGEILERVSGQSWPDFITARIFKPIGMSQCAANADRIAPGVPRATGHERAAGETHGTPLDPRMSFKEAWNAAGGIWCTSGDMMKWGQFWLDRGKLPDGTALLSEKQAQEVWKGVTPLGSGIIPDKGGATNLRMYALGWNLSDFEGAPMVSHSGGAPGVTSNFIILPQQKTVIFASSNDYMSTASAWTMHIADALVDGQQDADVVAKVIESSAKSNAEAAEALAKVAAPPKDARKPSLPLDAYTGTYRDPWYGTVTVTRRGRQLYLDMQHSELLDGPLTTYDGDTFAAIWPNRTLKADALVTFATDGTRATGIRMKAISEITDFSYDFHDLDLKRVE